MRELTDDNQDGGGDAELISNRDPDFLLRANRYLSGVADQEELAQLRKDLVGNEANCKALVSIAVVRGYVAERFTPDRGSAEPDIWLSALVAQSSSSAAAAPAAGTGGSSSRRGWKPPPWITAAVLVLLATIAAAIMVWRMSTNPDQSIAHRAVPPPTTPATTLQSPDATDDPSGPDGRLVADEGALWTSGPAPLPGSALPRGPLRLTRGVAELRLRGKTVLFVEGPAEFEIESASRVRLASGKIAANIAGRTAGFTIATPAAEIIDRGTEFGVCVTRDGAISQVQVFRGTVDVRPIPGPGINAATTMLREGQAATVARGSVTAQLAQHVAAPAFIRSRQQFASAVAPTQPKSIVGWWRFEDDVPPPPPGREEDTPQADVIRDSSGKGNGLTWWPGYFSHPIGAYRGSEDVPPPWMFRPGYSGERGSFVSGLVDPKLSGVLFLDLRNDHKRALSLSAPVTMELYFKTIGEGSRELTSDLLACDDQVPHVRLGINPVIDGKPVPGGVYFTVFDDAGAEQTVTINGARAADGRWHYVAARLEPQLKRASLIVRHEDGWQQTQSITMPGDFVPAKSLPGNVHVGTRKLNGSFPPDARFQGVIDEIRISNEIVPDSLLLAPIVEPQP